MAEKTFASLRDWVEPAHPAVIALQEELTRIYKLIRGEYQNQIDAAFDRVSKNIGFIVTTTIPVKIEVGDAGIVKAVSVAEHLKDTLFDKEVVGALAPLVGAKPKPEFIVPPGSYNLYLLWFAALNLRLRTDWMEPAHVARPTVGTGSQGTARVVPGVREPAHWFDPGIAIAGEEAVVISVIDHVYPELRLLDRVSASREAARRLAPPEVREPAHFLTPGAAQVVRAVRPEVLEPAHFPSQNREDLIKAIRSLLDKL